jgi:prepilin signal peptidase PulO-like enzyme (type II secretory pathway)
MPKCESRPKERGKTPRKTRKAMSAKSERTPDIPLYVTRRFIPALLLAVAATIACLFIDVTKVHWVGAISGAVLGAYFFLIKSRAEKIYFGDIRRRRGKSE